MSERTVAIVWQSVLAIGITVLVVGGFLLGRVYGGEATGGLALGWVLFGLGVLLTILGWWLRRARWLAIRVREADGATFRLAVPLPLGLAAAAVRVGSRFVPQVGEAEAEALAEAIRQDLGGDGVFYVHVDEGETGDRVDLTIG